MIRIALALLSAVLLLVSPTAFAQGANWTISEASGTVTVKTETAALQAKRGGQVPAGAVLATGANSRAVLFRGKDFMTLNANSRVRIPVTGQNGGGFFDVLQEWGNAVFKIEKKPDPHFSVRTPYLAAVVKGTTFSITVSDQGAALQVIEGAVATSTMDGGASELIRPGVVAMVEAADRLRLTVQDQQTRTIDSPARIEIAPQSEEGGISSSLPSASSEPASVEQPASAGVADPVNGNALSLVSTETASTETQQLTEAITATPSNLGAITDGFVSGSVVAQMASNAVATLRSNGGYGNANGADNGNAGVNGNGSANGADNGNAGGNGNGNDNGADNGNTGGNGNGNANGADNGNAGGNGNGNANGADNGNAGGNGNGNANGADNSNAGVNVNGNGNANGADNGNAGGNGNGNDNGAANGNANGADNGNAGGNGNGNAGGNS